MKKKSIKYSQINRQNVNVLFFTGNNATALKFGELPAVIQYSIDILNIMFELETYRKGKKYSKVSGSWRGRRAA